MHPFEHVKVTDGQNSYFSLTGLNDPRVDSLPYSIRVLLESVIRNCDEFEVPKTDVETVLNWKETSKQGREIAFKPARVLLQDFTGVPCCVDLAAMRDAVKRLGGDVKKINPLIPTELVIDHSVCVDYSRTPDALSSNESLEMHRNKERFQFLKWSSKSFKNFIAVPPGSGIVHQVNLEYLARIVFDQNGLLYPDSVVGTDSHTTMINGVGVVGWGVGGIEAEAVMLGQPISLVLPKVIGFELKGKLQETCTATDLVLTVTRMLRERGVVEKFVEFYGEGCASLSVADRATISNMSPENGSTIGFFPVDQKTIDYLRNSGRSNEKLDQIEKYLRKQKLFRCYDESDKLIEYSGPTLSLDLATVVPSVSGPKRPHDRVDLTKMPEDFNSCLTNPVGFKGFGLPKARVDDTSTFTWNNGIDFQLRHGSVVIAAITSCTNTSNPSVMLGAGILAKNAIEAGLKVAPYIKTSLSPGSHVVESYLKIANLLEPLQQLGFYLCGFGCQTCIGNSGDLDEVVANAINDKDIIAAAVLSGNRNFEGRINPYTRANYLCSPMLVLAYALAGHVAHDFETMPLGSDSNGKPIFLRDIWPSKAEIERLENETVRPQLFKDVYTNITEKGSDAWKALSVTSSELYDWKDESTYVHKPPFFTSMGQKAGAIDNIDKARCLLLLGDSVTTDHISPAGSIAKTSPAAKFLIERNVPPQEFNSYGSRRGNDQIMMRGTFANIRLINKLANKTGPYSVCFLNNETKSVFDVAEDYKQANVPLIIIAGKEYGCGSSRDWAAKGTLLLGVRAVIAQSFERIHRSNLVGMGLLPLQFKENESPESLNLTGKECYSIKLDNLQPCGTVQVEIDDGKSKRVIETICRIDTPVELSYFKHGGILQYVIRKALGSL